MKFKLAISYSMQHLLTPSDHDSSHWTALEFQRSWARIRVAPGIEYIDWNSRFHWKCGILDLLEFPHGSADLRERCRYSFRCRYSCTSMRESQDCQDIALLVSPVSVKMTASMMTIKY